MLVTSELDAVLLCFLKCNRANLGACAEVSASGIKSAELVCVAKSLCVDLGVVVLYVSHNKRGKGYAQAMTKVAKNRTTIAGIISAMPMFRMAL